MLDVGFVGWRGMVGSVLLERMRAEGDFEGLAPAFYSTSAPGAPGPDGLGFDTGRLGDAHDVGALARHDVIVTCQGGDYTKEVHPRLRAAGWNGYWIDAASALRMEPGTVLVLEFVDAMVNALKRHGCNALPVFCSSLREDDGAVFRRVPDGRLRAGHSVDVVVCTQSFAMSHHPGTQPVQASSQPVRGEQVSSSVRGELVEPQRNGGGAHANWDIRVLEELRCANPAGNRLD